jgi:preprotein translocase subunit YajC
MTLFFFLATLPMMLTQVAFAQAPAAPAAPSQPPAFMNLLPMVLIFFVFYFLMIRPQKKKQEEQQKMLSALSNGDEVITTSGMLGKIAGQTEKVVTLEVADGVKVKMLKSQISQVVKGNIKDVIQ